MRKRAAWLGFCLFLGLIFQSMQPLMPHHSSEACCAVVDDSHTQQHSDQSFPTDSESHHHHHCCDVVTPMPNFTTEAQSDWIFSIHELFVHFRSEDELIPENPSYSFEQPPCLI